MQHEAPGTIETGGSSQEAPNTSPRKPGEDNVIERRSLVPHETAEKRHARISEVAYGKACERGFTPGGELDDWLAAEREVDAEAPSGDAADSR